MKQSKRNPILRRGAAAVLALTVVWVVFAAAGSSTWEGALQALGRQGEWSLKLLRRELGDSREGWLTAATELVISQSPLLLSSRQAILSLQSPDDSAEGEEEPENQVIREEPVTPQQPQLTFADNGVTPKTLVPTTTEGYVIDGLAYINNYSNNPLAPEDLTGGFSAALGEGDPQVLIVHTHGSEAYTMPPGQEYEASGESRCLDTQYNVVRVGDEIASVLASYGISSIHDRNLYDYPQYNGAYDRSLASIESYLEKYPSITFVLDVHRDAISDGDGNPYKVVSAEAEGTAAQVSLVMGSNGSGLTHDHWLENLKLAAAVQNTILREHPTLMRPITLRNSRYNQHCTTGSLLVEVGAAGNSLDEALLAARLFAQGFAETILPPAA